MTATELGMRLGGLKAKHVNLKLTEHRFQLCTRSTKGDLEYEATELGRRYSRMVDQARANTDGSVLQLRWMSTVVEPLRALLLQEEIAS